MTTPKIQSGDIQLLASVVMTDDPEGGGGPSGQVIQYGLSNAIFADVTEVDRAGGDVSVRQLHMAVQTDDQQTLQDAYIVVSQPPSDPNLHITLAACGTFARRTEIAQAVANYLVPGSEWSGFLLENHVAGMRSITIFHRPGTRTPNSGETLLIVQNEGLGTERSQYVRVLDVETETQTFSYSNGSTIVDFQASVTRCSLSGPLAQAFTGSPPSRMFQRATGAAMIRATVVADAVTFFGTSPSTAVAEIGDSTIRVANIYTQLVPTSRSEKPFLDVKPAAIRTLTLAASPRLVEVAASPHTWRSKVTQESRAYNWVFLMTPLPAPGSISVSFRVMGRWYVCQDDGAGALTGDAVGVVNYGTGSIQVTLPELPDAGSSLIWQWGSPQAYTNRSGQSVSVRGPEYCWQLEHSGLVPGSLVLTWESASVLRTATANAAGVINGDGTGLVDYASGTVLLRPALMPDPGAEIHAEYDTDDLTTEIFTGPSVDAAGFVHLTLEEPPAAGTLSLEWVVARKVSHSSGATQTITSAVKDATKTTAVKYVPEVYEPQSTVGTGYSTGIVITKAP